MGSLQHKIRDVMRHHGDGEHARKLRKETHVAKDLTLYYKFTVLYVTAADRTWSAILWQMLAYLLMPVLVPVLLLASKLQNRPYKFGVTYQRKTQKQLDFEAGLTAFKSPWDSWIDQDGP